MKIEGIVLERLVFRDETLGNRLGLPTKAMDSARRAPPTVEGTAACPPFRYLPTARRRPGNTRGHMSGIAARVGGDRSQNLLGNPTKIGDILVVEFAVPMNRGDMPRSRPVSEPHGHFDRAVADAVVEHSAAAGIHRRCRGGRSGETQQGGRQDEFFHFEPLFCGPLMWAVELYYLHTAYH